MSDQNKNSDKPTKTDRILSAAAAFALRGAREVVDRVARAAYEAERSDPPWGEMGDAERDVWRRRTGNVLRAAALEVKKLNGE